MPDFGEKWTWVRDLADGGYNPGINPLDDGDVQISWNTDAGGRDHPTARRARQ